MTRVAAIWVMAAVILVMSFDIFAQTSTSQNVRIEGDCYIF